MTAIELFAGVGGFRLGLERAGHRVIWANEWDKYAANTYDKNFTDGRIDRRSITDVPATDIPAHKLLVGGFPCQAFSIAGKRQGFNETRGTLFFDIARIAAHHKTPYLILENVKGLLSHDGGRTFDTVVAALDELGYDLQWQVLNSKNHGVPQNRERIIIVGHLRGQPRPEVFPIGSADANSVKQVNNPVHSCDRIYDPKGISPTLNTMQGGRRQPFVQIPEGEISGTIDTGYAKNHRQSGATYIASGIAHRGRDNGAVWEPRTDGLANALRTAGGRGSTAHALLVPVPEVYRIRRLTPMECERLQGFPDGWTEGVSDTQRYKQMGNAVTTNVIEAVARRLPNE